MVVAMPEFAYIAVGPSGERRGVLSARAEEDAAAQLERMGLVPLSISQKRPGLLESLRKGKPKPQQVADAVRNLADLLATGGVPLLQALVSLRQEETSPAMAEVLDGLAAAVEGGRPLSEAMAARPDVFPEVVVRIVAASEVRGELDKALNEAARYLERSVSTVGKIRGAVAYPAFVLLIALGVVVFMSVGVMPKLAGMFAQSKIPLPLPTRVLLAFGTALAKLWYLAIGVVAGMVAGARYVLRMPVVRRRIDILAWKLPAVRIFVRNFAYARWSMTVGLMHASGVPLLETLRLARDVSGNAVLYEALGPVTDRVRDGEPLSHALRQTGVFPATVVQMVALGEEHGTLGEMLQRVGRRYEVQTERLLEKLPQFIEPAFIVVIGATVGIMLLAFYWPLVNVYQIAAKGG
jgi:type IV pilus assembly protein PilC